MIDASKIHWFQLATPTSNDKDNDNIDLIQNSPALKKSVGP